MTTASLSIAAVMLTHDATIVVAIKGSLFRGMINQVLARVFAPAKMDRFRTQFNGDQFRRNLRFGPDQSFVVCSETIDSEWTGSLRGGFVWRSA